MSEPTERDEQRCRAFPSPGCAASAAASSSRRLSRASASPRSRPSRAPACAGSTSSARRRSRPPGSRSSSTSTPSTSRTCCRATSGRRSTSTPTTCSSSCTSRSSTAQVKRLNAGELDIFVGRDFLVTIPNTPLQPVEYLFERCRQKEELREQLFSARLGLPALPDHRRQLRLLLPDAAQDRQQARRARGRDLRGPLRGHRPRHLQREAGDHQLPQGDPPAADRAARPREARAAVPRPRGRRARDLLRRRRRRPRADLGHARELQGGGRGARGDERVATSPTASTTSCACSPRSASSSCR